MSGRRKHSSGVEFAPCPFCDELEDLTLGTNDGWVFVQCHECGAQGPRRGTETGAVSSWTLLRIGAPGIGPSMHESEERTP